MKIRNQSVLAGLVITLCLAHPIPTEAQEFDQELAARGKVLVKDMCAECHAIESDDKSTHKAAPEFKNLVKDIDPENLAEAFAEGIVVGHPDMPEFILNPDQIGELIEYLKSLRTS